MPEKIRQNVLILNTDGDSNGVLLETLAALGIHGTVASSAAAAVEHFDRRAWDLLAADLDLLAQNGFDLLQRIHSAQPELPVLAVGGQDQATAAIQALRLGASEFLPRPLQRPLLEGLLRVLLPNHDVPMAADDGANARMPLQIAGCSRALTETLELARKIAPTSLPVLISGESGTGKELVAYLVHRASQRCQGPYIRVNCAALSESLLESELFGHERGAFTGAICQRKGRFERAHGGTLLLDEISETTPRLQAELLRVLEQQDFERVGGVEAVQVNVRVIATTNRDLEQEVRQGRFRRDLYYRINGMQLVTPALRERVEDIPALVWHFVNLYARETRRSISELDAGMLALFERCPWPGNVRQLRNVVRTALVLGSGPRLSLGGAEGLAAELAPEPAGWAWGSALLLDELERQAILEALRRTNRHQAKAARLLGITDRTLREKLRRYRQDGVKEAAAEVAGETQWLTEPA
jgi:DNA-binding NtrC family response regulator